MNITLNKHKIYDENLGIGFYLGRRAKKVNKKLYIYIFLI